MAVTGDGAPGAVGGLRDAGTAAWRRWSPALLVPGLMILGCVQQPPPIPPVPTAAPTPTATPTPPPTATPTPTPSPTPTPVPDASRAVSLVTIRSLPQLFPERKGDGGACYDARTDTIIFVGGSDSDRERIYEIDPDNWSVSILDATTPVHGLAAYGCTSKVIYIGGGERIS